MFDIDSLESCSVEAILSLIEVQPPYFALTDFYWSGDNWLVAKAPVQCESPYERTIMDASEVGRHLAILGSCCGALLNPEKSRHYYLAFEAQLETYRDYMAETRPDFLFARAKADFVNKRELHAETELIDRQGNICASLSVKYHVLKEKSFSRIYGGDGVDYPETAAGFNPYENVLSLELVRVAPHSLTASIGLVTPEMCPGHFAQVKALPVAIISQSLLHSSCLFLRNLLGDDEARFVLRACDLKAAQLAIAGQSVEVQVELIAACEDSFTTRTIARNQANQAVGEMLCQIDRRD